MAFIIDSNEWMFDGETPETVSCKLEKILDRLAIAKERDEKVYIGHDLQSKNVCSGMDLWTFLNHESMTSIERDILSELAANLNNAIYYESNMDIWPNDFPSFDVTDIKGQLVSTDMEFAYKCIQVRRPVGCLTLNDNRATIISSTKYGPHDIYLINDEINHKKFWRGPALTLLRDSIANLQYLSKSMYPNLLFFDGVWDGISQFSGGYQRTCRDLQKYLACLDDFGAWAFTEPPPATHPSDTVQREEGNTPSNQLIIERFAGFGLDVSPEKPNVRQNSTCLNARTIKFESEITKNKELLLYCEWHGKLEQHINRIHFHPPILDSSNKLIVAIFCSHLPLP